MRPQKPLNLLRESVSRPENLHCCKHRPPQLIAVSSPRPASDLLGAPLLLLLHLQHRQAVHLCTVNIGCEPPSLITPLVSTLQRSYGPLTTVTLV